MFDSAGGPYEAKATKAVSMAISFMYASGFWILAHHGLQLSKLIMVFLQGYTKCAQCCLRQGFHRFGLMPKMHYIHHAADRLRRESVLGVWVKNPLSESVQMQEDFIGRPSRLSRRVDVRQLHLRVVERSLINVQQALENSDQDRRGLAPSWNQPHFFELVPKNK